MKEKICVITGGCKGIGKALAHAFDQSGYKVIFTFRESSSGESVGLLKEIDDAVGMKAELSDYNEADNLAGFVKANYGRIDVLINNAGSCDYNLLPSDPAENIEKTINNNLYSVINTTKAFYDMFVSQKSGCIINISSVWGMAGASCESVYSAAKGGVDSFTKSMAKELAPSGIRVNAIAPGVIKTDMLKRFSEKELDDIKGDIPLGRLGTPKDVAGVALFLASDLASYITGEIIKVSGGYFI